MPNSGNPTSDTGQIAGALRFASTSSVETLSPQSQQPLEVTMNCLNGFFHFPYLDSLAEALVKRENGGAIAVFSPSGLSLNAPAHRYHQALQQLVDAGHRDVHRICGEKGMTHYENLVALHELVGVGRFLFIGLPLKIRGGTGSPVRAVALSE